MNHTTVNCSSCNKELKIKVAKGDNAPDRLMCKACSQGTLQKKPRRYIKRHNWTNTHKQDLTRCEKAARKRIYGSELNDRNNKK